MSTLKLVIEQGPQVGQTFEIKTEGVRLGRSVQNDVVLADAQLSRNHCKLFFRDETVWILDLATLNGTAVNGQTIQQETQLKVGDTITLGDTTLRICSDSSSSAPRTNANAPSINPTPESVPDVARVAHETPESPTIDLGFNNAPTPSEKSYSNPASSSSPTSPRSSGTPQANALRKIIRLSATAFLTCCILAWCYYTFLQPRETPSTPTLTPIQSTDHSALQIHYVKVEASTNNIFRYALTLGSDGILHATIEDMNQGRQVRKSSEAPIPEELREDLIRKFQQANFFQLPPRWEGIPRENTWSTFTLTGILNQQAHTVEVRNRLEPTHFQTLREAIETFARNELGLWAIEFPREKLLELSADHLALARRFYDERAIRLENLYQATRTYKSALEYLDTIEPKPEYFNAAVTELNQANSELDALYKDKNWQAEHAINTRNWDFAASTLRELMEIIPDRTDARHRDVERRLLDVETRIRKLKK